MTPTQQRALRIKKQHPIYGTRTALQMARGYDPTDDLARDLADTIDTRRTISTDDYDGAPAGWTLSASVDYAGAEPDPEGTYSAEPTGPDSIDRTRWGWHSSDHSFRYWTPGAYTFEDYRSDARSYGMARHAAYLYAWSCLERDEHRDRTAHILPVTVTASRAGIELGSATLGIGTSDDDTDDSYRADVLADLWPEAIENAGAALARLAPTA